MNLSIFYVLLNLFGLSAHAGAERIVVLAPVLAEWTYEILGDRALDTLVGTTEYSDYPIALKKIERIGPYPQINVEKIAKLNPTLIIASAEYNRADQLEKLKRLKLNVETMPAETFSKMESWIIELGRVLKSPEGAKAAARRWKEGLAALRKGNEQRVMIEVQAQPLVVVGGMSFLTEALKAIGMVNVFQDLKQTYPKVSQEAVLRENPDQILIMDLTGKPEDFESSKNNWLKFSHLKAVEKSRIKIISGDEFARCSPRLLKALKQLQ